MFRFSSKVISATQFYSKELNSQVNLSRPCLLAVIEEFRKKRIPSLGFLNFRDALLKANPQMDKENIKKLWGELRAKKVEELQNLLPKVNKKNHSSRG